MTWEPNPREPSANFEGPIIDNTLTIITRDFKGALDYYFPTDNYPDFRERRLGQIEKLNFPCLAVGPRSNDVDEADHHLIEAARIDIYIGVTSGEPDTVTRLIMKYVKVMNAVLRSARNDFFTGMSNPFGVILDINHIYTPIGENENKSIYFRGAFLELTVNLREL